MVRLVPHFGTAPTTVWYSSYHALVQFIPRFGTSPVTGWYAPYQPGYSFRFPLYFLFSRRLIVIIRYLCVRIGCGSANREMPYQHQAVL
ncbi:MAG: hypothetical protein EGP63_04225 [Bacteroides stercoris]|nr:hypothetical protein [Bacteroides stercoris]